MNPIPGVQDPALVLIILAALIAGGFVVFVFTYARTVGRQPLGANDDLKHYRADNLRPDWIGAVAVLLVIVAVTSWASQRDERILAAERKADREAELVRMGCPPREAGDTDIVVLTIDTSADLHSTNPRKIIGCARYVERGWGKPLRKQVAAQ